VQNFSIDAIQAQQVLLVFILQIWSLKV